MNFLAHIYLSGNNKEIIIGNFMADGVKGRNYTGFSENVIKGIELHRRIDSFTDKHPLVSQSKQRLYAHYHHYSSVIVDVFYDHFLAKNWQNYSDVSLNDYVQEFYLIAQNHIKTLPERTRLLLPYMIKDNWLLNYKESSGVGKALSGMARRTRFASKMELAVNDLNDNYFAFENDFNSFFPQLQKMSNDWLIENLPK